MGRAEPCEMLMVATDVRESAETVRWEVVAIVTSITVRARLRAYYSGRGACPSWTE